MAKVEKESKGATTQETFRPWSKVFGECKQGGCEDRPVRYRDRKAGEMKRGDFCHRHREEGYEALKAYARSAGLPADEKEITLEQLQSSPVRGWMFSSDDVAKLFLEHGAPLDEAESKAFEIWADDLGGLNRLYQNMDRLHSRPGKAGPKASRRGRKPDAPASAVVVISPSAESEPEEPSEDS